MSASQNFKRFLFAGTRERVTDLVEATIGRNTDELFLFAVTRERVTDSSTSARSTRVFPSFYSLLRESGSLTFLALCFRARSQPQRFYSLLRESGSLTPAVETGR